MAIYHIQTNITGLLRNCSPKKLDNLFGMSNGDAKKEILKLRSKGHKLIPSSNCKHFDPTGGGCRCREFEGKEVQDFNPMTKDQFSTMKFYGGMKAIYHGIEWLVASCDFEDKTIALIQENAIENTELLWVYCTECEIIDKK